MSVDRVRSCWVLSTLPIECDYYYKCDRCQTACYRFYSPVCRTLECCLSGMGYEGTFERRSNYTLCMSCFRYYFEIKEIVPGNMNVHVVYFVKHSACGYGKNSRKIPDTEK